MRKLVLVLTIAGAVLATGCGSNDKQEAITYSIKDNVTIGNDEQDTTAAANNDAATSTEVATTKAQDNDKETSGDKADSKNEIQNVSDDKFAYTVHDRYMDLDSDKGPYYIIDLDSMSIVDCTSAGAKVVNYKKEGDILTITLYSNEYPVNSTYVIDLSTSTKDNVTSQSIENNVLKFSSEKGPDYEIDLNTMKLISCSDKSGRIVKSSLDGNKLTLVLYSRTLPVDMTYEFTIK